MKLYSFNQRDISLSSSSGSSIQSPEPLNSTIYYSCLENQDDRANDDPSHKSSEIKGESQGHSSSPRLTSSPSPSPPPPPLPPISPHNRHPTTNPRPTNNWKYQLPSSQPQRERDINFFPHPHHSDIDEPSCLCLPPALVKLILNLAKGIAAVTRRVIEFVREGADWAPPVPPESETESDIEEDLDQHGRRRRRRRERKGPPPPIFVPVPDPALFQNAPVQEEELRVWEWGREPEGWMIAEGYGEGNDDDMLDRNGRIKKKWKGKGKAVDVGDGSRSFLGRYQGEPGQLRRGAYVPVEPDRRGTVWYPKLPNLSTPGMGTS